MATGQHYDVAVVGMRRSGVIAAALLAKRGRRVLLVDHGEGAQTYRRKGIHLPLAPGVIPDFADAPQVQQVIEELGIGPDLRARTESVEPSFQAIMHGHRFDLSGDRDRTQQEVAAEFPQMGDAVVKLLGELERRNGRITEMMRSTLPVKPTTLGERWRSRSQRGLQAELAAPITDLPEFAALPPHHPLRELLLAPARLFGYMDTDTPSLLQGARLISGYLSGVVTLGDPLVEPSAHLLDAALRAGVEVRRGALVSGMDLDGKRISELHIEEDRLPYHADFFIANTLEPFHELLPAGKASTALAAEHDLVRATGSLMVVNFVVRQEVIPRGMAQALFMVGEGAATGEGASADPLLFLRRYPARRALAGSKPGSEVETDPDLEVLSVATRVRRADVVHSPELFAGIKRTIHKRVQALVPFLDDHLVDTSLPVDTAAWDLEPSAGPHGGRRVDPWDVHPFYSHDEAQLGVGGRSPRTALKNLVHCGCDVLPGLGLEGEYATGLVAADTLAEVAGKQWKQKGVAS